MIDEAQDSFNSKLVRLKAFENEVDDLIKSEFQFQTGSIKSPEECKRILKAKVSIPNWFD